MTRKMAPYQPKGPSELGPGILGWESSHSESHTPHIQMGLRFYLLQPFPMVPQNRNAVI